MTTHRNHFLLTILFSLPFVTGFSLFDGAYVSANKLYEDGKYAEALAAYEKAQDTSDESVRAAIHYKIGSMYFDGEGTTAAPETAFRYFDKVSNSESKSWAYLGKNKLAEMYRDGIGVKRDTEAAFRLYEQITTIAPKSAVTSAYWSMGHIRENSPFDPSKDSRSEAARYYQKCLEIDKSYKACKTSLELLLEYADTFVQIDAQEYGRPEGTIAPGGMAKAYDFFSKGKFAEAFNIFHWHAKNGNAEAQVDVARQYSQGLGAEKNPKRASGWIFMAARNGNALAQREYGTAIVRGIVWGNTKEAIYWLEASGAQGNAEAFNELGRVWLNPIDESKELKADPVKAVEMFSKAAELGSITALTNLGLSYLNGIGVAQDKALAKQLFQRASAKGNARAKLELLQHFNIGSTATKESPPAPPKASPAKQDDLKEAAPERIKIVEKIVEKVIYKPVEVKPEKPSPVEVFAKTSPSVFTLIALSQKQQTMSQGSAVAISPHVAVTNCHVIRGMEAFGTKISEEVFMFSRKKSSEAKDICLISGSTKIPPIVATRSFSDLKVGEKVFSIGSPKGLNNTFSEGNISGLRVIDGVKTVQTSAPITNGSSGGALLDEHGRLVGITTSGLKDGNINFAVSVDEVFDLLR